MGECCVVRVWYVVKLCVVWWRGRWGRGEGGGIRYVVKLCVVC